MDVIRKNKTKKNKVFIVLSAIILVAFLFFLFSKGGDTRRLAKQDASFATIKKGELTVEVSGYGNLISDKRKILTSLSGGMVEEIILKPGALVVPGSIILRLKNPALAQEVQLATMELNQQKNAFRQLKINNKRDLLTELDRLSEVESELELVKVNLEAEQKLVEEGIVSQLNYKRTVVQERQLTKRVKVLYSRVEQLEELHEESLKSQLEVIKQFEESLQIVELRQESLTVKADMEGVLQHLPVELGQSVAEGEQLAVVGSTKELVALIRIPQTQISQIALDQPAVIDTHQDKINGKVRRIEPSVEDGNVTVEIALDYPLPESARPESSVDGRIITQTLANVMYVQRPVNTRTNTTKSIFKADLDNDEATKAAVTFGAGTERIIQVVSGAQVGETLIISDTSSHNDVERLSLTN